MPRRVRAAAQAAAQSMKAAPPPVQDASDDEMVDAPLSHPTSPPPADGDVSNLENNGDNGEEDAEEGGAPADQGDVPTSPVQPSDPASGASSPAPPSVGRPSLIPRKRRLGRPPKNRPPDWDTAGERASETPVRVTTPGRRGRRGRPGATGGRWAKYRGPSHVTQVPIDKEGNMMDVVNDEVALPEDPEGETKVDKLGHLLGGREYRVRTFTLLNRGERLYMLSTEPARCIGFRDSYLFFQKHKTLFKIIIDDDAKRDLIEREIIPHSYKGRAIGVVTARSVFREFGAKIIVGGRKIIDEYHVKAARERGDVEGELAVPEDRLPPPGEPYNKNQFVAWHGASSVYHTGAPAVPIPTGKVVDPKKRRVAVTGDNWMIEHAREASIFNSAILQVRRANLDGVYDIHTNFIQYPKIMQPSHARWEHLHPDESKAASALTKGISTLRITNDSAELAPSSDPARTEPAELPASVEPSTHETIFSTIPPVLTRRFAIHDVIFESPPVSNLGIPGPDGDIHDLGPNGLITLSDPNHPEFMTPDVLAELPPECKEALIDAAAQEYEWKSQWRSESVDGARLAPLKNYAWFP